MAQGLANQIVNSVPGMGLVAVYGRQPERAREVLEYAGRPTVAVGDDAGEVEDAIRDGRRPVVDGGRARTLSRAEQIDVVVDVTGSVELGARSRWRRSRTASTSSP